MCKEKIREGLGLYMEIVIFSSATTYTPFEKFLRPFLKDAEDNCEPYKVENIFETAIIVFSSGSTGSPKGICMNDYAILG